MFGNVGVSRSDKLFCLSSMRRTILHVPKVLNKFPGSPTCKMMEHLSYCIDGDNHQKSPFLSAFYGHSAYSEETISQEAASIGGEQRLPW